MAFEFSCGSGVPSEVCDRDHYETINATEAATYFIQNYGYRRVLEKSICLRDGNCFDIVDGVVYLDDRYVFTRDIAEGDLLLSRMYLKLPRKVNYATYNIYDTAQWKVNKTKLDFASYTTTMIEEMFTSGAVDMSRESEAQVLSIGLGAGFVNSYLHYNYPKRSCSEEMFTSGAVDMSRETEAQVLSIGLGAGFVNSYLHYNYPKLNITVVDIEPKIVDVCLRWFDLQLDERHRAIVADGVKFIHDAAKEGVAIFNVINLYGKIQESAKMMRKSFEKDFRVCTIKLAPYSRPNMVMTCGQELRPPGLKQRYMKFAKYPKEAEYEDVYIS
ncbi:hypothetical protein OESDEN_07939 [Oesophagostomum dentatum]|uniref:Spermine/spermidine synthase n=1 Tax=Oesophagostomum dentatum TaxID=61180 RepID=A0A0B1T3R7_OESDE|nr:hypothetical protein OESDEN_07939 [Oesophagostomum dentatum]